MRTPTPMPEAYAWWSAALAGSAPAITGDAHCGYFRRRLVREGPWVPARIWLHQDIDPATGELMADEVMLCEVNGSRRDPVDQWIWLCSNPITREEYRFLQKTLAWAKNNSPAEADPTKPVDFNKLPLDF